MKQILILQFFVVSVMAQVTQDIRIYAPVQLVNTLPEAYQVYIFDKDNEVDALLSATYMPE